MNTSVLMQMRGNLSSTTGVNRNMRMHSLIASQVLLAIAAAQSPPPPPPRPPVFMSMKGLPLACFSKPNFEEDGVEIFVCNGGGGMAGFRKKADPRRLVFVHDSDIAQNLNMQSAKAACPKGFAVTESGGVISFLCDGKEVDLKSRFRSASGIEWKKYASALAK